MAANRFTPVIILILLAGIGFVSLRAAIIFPEEAVEAYNQRNLVKIQTVDNPNP